MQRRRKPAGFTLGELMVVLAILAVLMVIVLPSFKRGRSEAQLASCVQNLRSMGTAVGMYMSDYPGMTDMPAGFYSPISTGPWTYLVPRYLAKIPVCPSSGAGAMVTYPLGYVWLDYWPSPSEDQTRFPYVMCLGGHKDILPAAAQAQGMGPVWSARRGIDDCRAANPYPSY